MTLPSTRRIVLVACAVFFAQSLSYGAGESKSRIYSNVEYNREGGDLLGYELELLLDGSRVTGVLRIYEGGRGNPSPVAGTVAGSKISLSGNSEVYGRVEISGSMSDNLVKAILHMEKAVKPESIKLKTIPKPHC
jgi:hypothetical protein